MWLFFSINELFGVIMECFLLFLYAMNIYMGYGKE